MRIVALVAFPCLAALPAPVLAQDLGEHYPATLTRNESDPEPLDWVCGPGDVWELSGFEFVFEKKLKLKLRASTLVVGQHDGNAVWAVVLPDKPAKLTSALGGSGEKIDHVWLRFHPARVGELFPERSVRGPGPPGARLEAYRIYRHKLRAHHATDWQEPAGGEELPMFEGHLPVLPPYGEVVLDMDTVDGKRLAFSVDTDTAEIKLHGKLLTRPVPAPPKVARKRALAAFERASVVARSLRDAGFGPQELDWDEHEEACRKSIGRVKNGFQLAAGVHAYLSPLDPSCLVLEVEGERVPAVAPDERPRNASPGGIERILGGKLEESASGHVLSGATDYGVGYLQVRELADESVLDEIDQVLDGMQETWGLMLDLRHGLVGTDVLAARLAGRFVAAPTPYARFVAWEDGVESVRELVAEPAGEWAYGGFVYALVGPRTAGEAERLALAVAARPGGFTVGEPTAGLGLGARRTVLTDGVTLLWRGGRTLDAEGQPLPLDGLVPAKPIAVEPEAFTRQADPLLFKALEDIYRIPHEERLTARTREPWPWPEDLGGADGEDAEDSGDAREGGDAGS